MPPNNPYIEKVLQDTDIITDEAIMYSHKGKWNTYFWNENDIVLEIGTGMGNFFSRQVSLHPEKNFIGMEIRYKRLFQTAQKSRKATIPHFVMLKAFWQNIWNIFAPQEISQTYIFFPDPWANKDRQRKHRLLQTNFLENLYNVTKNGGKLFFKTDHREYFDSTHEIIKNQWLWTIKSRTHNYEESENFDMNNITEFEWFYRGEKTDINYIELVK